jgi:2-dehydro-3-deoxyglucarate aldolase
LGHLISSTENTVTTLKAKLAKRQLTVGSWLSIASTETAEIMLGGGYDWLCIDMEHTAIGTEAMAKMMQVVALGGSPVLVRVGANDALLIKRAMDSGATGVIVPMINTADEARLAVEALYYPPRGKRGVGLARAQGYGRNFEAYREWADRESVLIVQIEHHEGVRNLEAILAVDGVDAFMIGPYDLSGSLGRPGDFDSPAVAAALEQTRAVMQRSVKPGGLHIVHPDPATLRARVAEGYRFIVYGVDQIFFANAVDRDRAELIALNAGAAK